MKFGEDEDLKVSLFQLPVKLFFMFVEGFCLKQISLRGFADKMDFFQFFDTNRFSIGPLQNCCCPKFAEIFIKQR